MDKSILEQIIAKYHYEANNVIDKTISIHYFPEKNGMRIDNFYSGNETPFHGTCSKLALSLFHELSEQFPKRIAMAEGHDSLYFTPETNAPHYFLLLFNEPIEETISSGSITKILEQNPLLVDPSFKTISDFTKSEYDISKIRKKFKIREEKHLDLQNKQSHPICFCGNDLMYVAFHKQTSGKIHIGFQKPHGFIQTYSINDPRVDQKVYDVDRARKAVENLRNAEENAIYIS